MMPFPSPLRASRRYQGAGDVLPGFFVRHVAGSSLGLVNSIDGDCATVSDLSRPGHREIVPCAHLIRQVFD